jgi:hypothetical protein
MHGRQSLCAVLRVHGALGQSIAMAMLSFNMMFVR